MCNHSALNNEELELEGQSILSKFNGCLGGGVRRGGVNVTVTSPTAE